MDERQYEQQKTCQRPAWVTPFERRKQKPENAAIQQKENQQQKSSQQMNREQIKNILKELQNKPVQRKKERSNDRESLEKNW